jgi:hypothetical protein
MARHRKGRWYVSLPKILFCLKRDSFHVMISCGNLFGLIIFCMENIPQPNKTILE